MQIKKHSQGFTLLELLVVVLIIGILAAIALPQYKKTTDRAQFSIMLNIAKAMAEANERFYMVNDRYSTKVSELDIDIPAKSINSQYAYFDWGECQLYVRKGVYCSNISKLKNQVLFGYRFNEQSDFSNQIICMAKGADRNSRYAKVCEGFGNYYTTSSCEYIGKCMFYKIRH